MGAMATCSAQGSPPAARLRSCGHPTAHAPRCAWWCGARCRAGWASQSWSSYVAPPGACRVRSVWPCHPGQAAISSAAPLALSHDLAPQLRKRGPGCRWSRPRPPKARWRYRPPSQPAIGGMRHHRGIFMFARSALRTLSKIRASTSGWRAPPWIADASVEKGRQSGRLEATGEIAEMHAGVLLLCASVLFLIASVRTGKRRSEYEVWSEPDRRN